MDEKKVNIKNYFIIISIFYLILPLYLFIGIQNKIPELLLFSIISIIWLLIHCYFMGNWIYLISKNIRAYYLKRKRDE